MTDDSIYSHSGPYWFYTDDTGAPAGGGDDDPLMRTIKAIAGTIIMFVLGLALCSLLPSCSSARRAESTETSAAQRTEETSGTSETADSTAASRATTSRQQTAESSESSEEWYTTHMEKTTWSEPDSLGRQHIISTETLDRSGGTSRTRQDTSTSSQAVDLADSTSLSRGQTTGTRATTESEEKTTASSREETEGAGATAARSAATTALWALAAAAACLLAWRYRAKISAWIWRMLLRLKG